jgi:hypothetical protein
MDSTARPGYGRGVPTGLLKGAATGQDHAGENALDGASSSSRQALLARAHQQACIDELRPAPLPTDASALAQLSPDQMKRLTTQQSMWLAAYRRMLEANGSAMPSDHIARELKAVDTMLGTLLGKDSAALLREHCALLLASAEFDAYCASKLELAHRPICGLPITRKELWDLAAGAFAFTGCFGPGTFLAKYFGNPWISFGLNAFTWMLSERMIPLIRMTTWRSEAADSIYPKLARANVRRAKFALARSCGYRVKAPKVHRPTALQSDRMVTQRQYVEEMGGMRASAKAWLAKLRTDDFPYGSYSGLYTARGIAWDLTVRDRELRKLPKWRAINATTHCAAGVVAGAVTMLIMQKARQAQCRATLPADKYAAAEKLTETPEIQRLKLAKLEAELALLKAEQARPISMERHIEIEEKLKLKEMQIIATQARCTWPGLIREEFLAAYQTSWTQDFADQQFFGEVPGKLFDTIAGLLGKYSCLLVYMLLITQISWFTIDPQDDSTLDIVLKNCVANLLLIAMPNFMLRTEWTTVHLFLLGMIDLLTQPLRELVGCGSYVHHEDNERVIVPDHETRAILRSRASMKSLSELPSVEEVNDEEAPTSTNSRFMPGSSKGMAKSQRRGDPETDAEGDDGTGTGLVPDVIDGGDDDEAQASEPEVNVST